MLDLRVLGVALHEVGGIPRVRTQADEAQLVEVVLALVAAAHLAAPVHHVVHNHRVRADRKLAKQFPISMPELVLNLIPRMRHSYCANVHVFKTELYSVYSILNTQKWMRVKSCYITTLLLNC